MLGEETEGRSEVEVLRRRACQNRGSASEFWNLRRPANSLLDLEHRTINSVSDCCDGAAAAMDTLDDSEWDVVISGTGLPQSLLALYALLLAR